MSIAALFALVASFVFPGPEPHHGQARMDGWMDEWVDDREQ